MDTPADPSERLQAAVDAQDAGAVIGILQRDWSELITGDLALLYRALDGLPAAVLTTSPRWVAAKAWVEHRLRGADAIAFRNIVPDVNDGAAFDRLTSLTLRLADKRAKGDFAGALEDTERARRLVAEATDAERTVTQYAFPVLLNQWSRVYELAGDPGTARTLLQESFDLSSWVDDTVSARAAAGRLAWIDAVEGRHDSAEMWVERAAKLPARIVRLDTELFLSRALRDADLLELDRAAADLSEGLRSEMHPESWASILFVDAHAGDIASAPADLDRLLAAESTHPAALARTGRNLDLITHAKVRLHLLTGDTAGALAATDGLPPQPGALVARAVALLANDLNQSVVTIAKDVHPLVTRHPRWRSKLYAVEAIALARLGLRDPAIVATRRVLESVRRLGLLSSLTLLSSADLALLEEMADGDQSEAFERVLAFASPRVHVPVSSLTERERVVLELIGLGRSTAQIAAELFLSSNTIKTQTASIYRKLGAESRNDLIVIARALPPCT